MKRKALETIIGAFVLLGAIAFVFHAFSESTFDATDGYELQAEFNRVDGILPGTEVRMSGIKIGSVLDSRLDPQTYLAIVRLSIRESIQIPEDSSIRVLADGLLGDSYLSIEPGGSDEMLAAGGTIARTQDPINIVDLLGRFAFGSAEETPDTGGGLGSSLDDGLE